MRLAILVTIYAAINVSGLILLRRGMADAPSLAGAIGEPRVLVGGVLYASSFLIFIASLRFYPITTVAPLYTGSVYVGATLAAWLILDEHVGPRTVVGIALVGLGILIVPK